MPIELVSTASSDIFPGWCAVAQMGHVCHRGYATVDTQLGIPMIRVVLPAVEGDDSREALADQVVLVAPGSLYGVTPTTEAAAIESRKSSRPWRPLIDQPRLVSTTTIDVWRSAHIDDDTDDESLAGDDDPSEDLRRLGAQFANDFATDDNPAPVPVPLRVCDHPDDGRDCGICNPPF